MRPGSALYFRLPLLLIFIVGLLPFDSAAAAASLTVTPITWNVVGLDSNNVNVGPNTFPVGARVCNTGTSAAANVSAAFNWTSAVNSTYIYSRPGSLTNLSIASLANGSCYDFYFEVEILRNSASYKKSRPYVINVTADGGISASTPTPREIYVELLVSQSRNSTTDVKLDGVSIAPGGTMALVVGETYDITLVGKTATNGYEQIETFINFPNTIFQVNSVQTTYSADTSPTVDNPSDMLYGDGCVWQNDPNNPQYRSCLSTGKAGGNIEVEYNVTIIGGAGTTNILNTLIYDFSGSSYHYNSDFSVAGRIAVIIDPTLVTISKNFNPDPTTAGGISVLTLTLTNPNGAAVSGVNFTDPLPSSPGPMSVASTPNASTSGCGTPTFAPAAGATTLSFSNGTIAANGTCTISVNVTVPTAGTYNNTTANLFIGTVDTGKTASDSLTVNAAPPSPACISGMHMATWNFLDSSNATNPAPTTSSVTASASAGSGLNPVISTENTAGASGSWASDLINTGALNTANNEYFEFAVNTTGFQSVTLSFSGRRTAQGAQNIQLYYGVTPTTASDIYSINSQNSWISFGPTTISSGLNPNGITYFRLYAYNAAQNNTGHNVYIDGVTFTGCGVPQYPTLTKSFSPDPIAVNGVSTLTFTITNPNASVAFSGITFTDSLPSGLQVAATPSASTTCGGSPTWSPAAGSNSLTFGSPTGATLAANSSCTVSVNVTATTTGPHTNVSGFISATYLDGGGNPNTFTNNTTTGSATDTLTAVLPPAISKLFSPNPILVNGTSTLTFTIANPNQNDTLTGVTFTDTFPTLPAAMTVASPLTTSNTCGGTLQDNLGGALSAGDAGIRLVSGALSGGASCTVSVNVTVPSSGDYVNTSGAVTATIPGGTDTASDTLTANAPTPSIALLKQVGLTNDPNGAWSSFLSVSPGTTVYYKFTIENTGDVPLTPVSISDDTLNVASCNTAWSSLTLQVADANDDDHIATCILSGGAAAAGSLTNTATATGYYSGTPYTSTSSAATYATPELTLEKSAAETYFVNAGDTLNYSYLVTNTGFVPLEGPVTVTDDKAAVTCSEVSTAETAPSVPGDGDNYLDPGEYVNCTAVYTVTAGDVLAGSVTNTATASADGVDSNEDSVTVPRQLPDLTVSKANDTGGSGVVGTPFTWTLTVANTGILDATFADGQTLLSDPLPAGAAYGAPTAGSFTGITNSGNISCSIVLNNLTCVASGADVTIDAATGSFAISFSVTPTVGGNLSNTATVDPDNDVTESNEANNTGTNTVTVSTAPNLGLAKSNGANSVTPGGTTTYTLTVSNTGDTATSGTITIVDVLPAGMNIADGAVTLGGTNAGDWTCNAASNVITCTSSAVIAGTAGTSVFNFTVNVDAGASGALINRAQAGGGGDPTNPNPPTSTTAGQCTGTNAPNEGCAVDADTANAPSLGLSKSNGASTVTAGGTTTYTLTVSNTGDTATSGTITVVDVLPAGMSIADGAVTPGGANAADWTCSAASNVITCTSSAVIAATTGTSVFSFTVNVEANASGTLVNRAQVGGGGDPLTGTPDAASAGSCTGTDNPTKGCAVDSDTVLAPDLDLAKSDGVSTVTAGGTTTYTLTVSNTGNTATSGTITIVDVLPAGMNIADGAVTLGGTNAGDWTCSAASNVITCTSSASIPATTGTSVFSFTVNVEADASGTLINRAQAGGGGDPTNPNAPTSATAAQCTGAGTPNEGCAVDSDTVNAPDVSLAKSNGVTSVPLGGTATYVLTVSNGGNVSTSGTITVVDVLPAGMSIADGAVTLGGTNAGDWTCSAASNVVTCTSSAVVPAGGASEFSFTVNILPNASGTLINRAQAGGGGDPTNPDAPTSATAAECTDANTPNEGCAVDSDTVSGVFDPPSATKTFNDAGLPQLEFRMVWINSGNNFAIDVQVTDEIPTGTTYVPNSLTCEPRGSSTNAAAASSPLSPTAVPDSFCGYDAANNRIQWQGNIGPDDGNLTEAAAANEVVITFRVTVNDGVNQVLNQGFARTDMDDDSNFDEETILGVSFVSSNQVVWNRNVSGASDPDPVELPAVLPATGFAPGRVTALPEQPGSKGYAATDVWLEIPRLGVRVAIVGVPLTDGAWDLTWLGSQAGWLEGTAFPSWRGNSGLTGHVTLADGSPGPFANLSALQWGDRVIVHAYGYAYTYEVRENKNVSPTDTSALKHEKDSWLTLITCRNYNESSGTYARRVSVRAVLIGVSKESVKPAASNVR